MYYLYNTKEKLLILIWYFSSCLENRVKLGRDQTRLFMHSKCNNILSFFNQDTCSSCLVIFNSFSLYLQAFAKFIYFIDENLLVLFNFIQKMPNIFFICSFFKRYKIRFWNCIWNQIVNKTVIKEPALCKTIPFEKNYNAAKMVLLINLHSRHKLFQ